LASAAAIVARYGYDEINLNCGCPSDRVAGAGCFGAALMKDPARVAAATAAMRAASGTEITVKCRLGVDGLDSYAALCEFVRTVSGAGGVTHFIIHARTCLLNGLSPAQNRAIPPLRPGWVLALARDFPHLRFTLNGGLAGSHAVADALKGGGSEDSSDFTSTSTASTSAPPNLVGGMVGRAAYHTPWHALADADVGLYACDANGAASRRAVLAAYAAYADSARAAAAAAVSGGDARRPPSVRCLVAPLLGLFHGAPRARAWRHAVDGALRAGPATVAEVLEVRRRERERVGWDGWVVIAPLAFVSRSNHTHNTQIQTANPAHPAAGRPGRPAGSGAARTGRLAGCRRRSGPARRVGRPAGRAGQRRPGGPADVEGQEGGGRRWGQGAGGGGGDGGGGGRGGVTGGRVCDC
jgi:tRNA-dihydrouridine synthase A